MCDIFFFSSRRRHTRLQGDWSSDVCSSDLPMTQSESEAFVAALLAAELYPLHDFEHAAHFEGCLPVEEIASRGIETLRFGPMKPIGLEHPITGERPHAVVQLRKEDLSDEYFNLVSF